MSTLIDKPKPGMFKAVCKLGFWTPDLAGLILTGAPTTVSKWDKKQGCNVFQAQCSVEFTDRGLFDAHMREVHGKKKSSGDLAPWSQSIKRGWKAPKLKDEGQPFKVSTPSMATDLKKCASCGLVAEVDDRAVNVRWWDEHENLCAGAEQDVA